MKSGVWIFGAAVFLSIVLFGSNLHAAAVQWKIEDGGNGHWYERVDFSDNSNWHTARDDASSHSKTGYTAHLATITSEAEQNFILDNLGGINALCQYWLGGYQTSNAGSNSDNWTWVTGESWDYTNWNGSEPNNHYGGGYGDTPNVYEDALNFWHSSNGYWNDMQEYALMPGYILEYSNVPIPSAVVLLGSALIFFAGFIRKRQ